MIEWMTARDYLVYIQAQRKRNINTIHSETHTNFPTKTAFDNAQSSPHRFSGAHLVQHSIAYDRYTALTYEYNRCQNTTDTPSSLASLFACMVLTSGL